MDSNKDLQPETQIKEQYKKVNKEQFDWNKYNWLFKTANDFFEAAIRCDFDESVKINKYPLMIPNFTNRAFACELYLKSVLYLTKNVLLKEHKLDKLFLKLNKENQKEIYDIWRTIAGENIQDCDYVKRMFDDNLEANSDVFTRFRYVHEWARASISLQKSLTEKQFRLHPLNANRPIGSSSIYDGFLDQFAKSIKKYNNELFKLKLEKENNKN